MIGYINIDLDSALSNASSTTPGSSTGGTDHSTQLAPQHSVLIAGVDEVGRGALFGPVVAAAVILPPSALREIVTYQIRDSKQLSSYRRLKLAEKICAIALDWKIGFASTAEIDQINILQASLLAMKRAVLKLNVQPALCLVDGNQPLKDLPVSQLTLVKGDERSLVIASASIIAKVWRDALLASNVISSLCEIGGGIKSISTEEGRGSSFGS